MSCQWGLGEVLTQRPGKLGECSRHGSSPLLLAHRLILLFPCTLASPDSLPGERLTLRLNLTLIPPALWRRKFIDFCPLSPNSKFIEKETLIDPAWIRWLPLTQPTVSRGQEHMTQDGCLGGRLLEWSLSSGKMLRRVPHESEVRERSQSQRWRVEYH